MYKTIEVTIKIDEDTWATEYGIEPGKIAEDVDSYFTQDIVDALNSTHAFGPVPVVKAVTVGDDQPSYLVIGQMCWGYNKDLNVAKRNFRHQGGQLSRGYSILTFPSGTMFHGVDDMGRYSWSGDAPEVKEVPARG